MRLHTKILLVVIPLVIAPVLLLGWLTYEQLQKTGRERTSSQMTTLMNQLTDNFKIHTNVARANIELFANSSLMRAYALTDDEEERYLIMLPSLLKLFKSYLQAYPEYYEIRFLLPDGYEDARATLKAIPNSTDEEEETPFFKSLLQSSAMTFSQALTNPDNGKFSLQVARQIKLINLAKDDPLGTEPRLRGYLVVTIDLEHLARQIKINQIGRSGQVFVVNKKGSIIFHKDEQQLGQQIPSMLRTDLLALKDGETAFSKSYLNQRAIYSSRTLHENLLLVGMLPETELLHESSALGKTVAWIIVLTILLTVAALLAAMQVLILRPLKKLIQAVDDIGSGQLNPRIPLLSRDELGQLATSFQDMGHNLTKSRQKIERLAYHDSLTGLPNRLLFREYLQHMIAFARRENNKMAVLFLDLDNFKRVNDTLGHHVGDLLLKEMAARLKSVLRAEDFVYKEEYKEISEVLARLGGDEFIILLPSVKDSHDAAKVAARILDVTKQPFDFEGHELFSGTSIGITLFPNDGTEVNDLIKRADVAMYHAKEQGRNNFQFYSASYNQATTAHLSLESKLRRALENDEFELYYQSQVASRTGKIAGFEALIRWNDPKQGIISPDKFIPIAEDSGLILPIGEWVLREACRQLRSWRTAGLPKVFMSVNVSGIQLQRQDIASIIRQVLSETGMSHSYLEIEFTETVLMKIKKEVIDQLHELKAEGLAISLDDFGTGYSSLNRLRQLPISKLKIDKSFVKDMIDVPQDAAIVSAIQHIATNLGLQTTAEGVETIRQAERLTSDGCNYLQGYLLSRPLPAVEATGLLKNMQDNRTFMNGTTSEPLETSRSGRNSAQVGDSF